MGWSVNLPSRIDVFLLTFFRKTPIPVIALLKVILGIVVGPVILIFVLIWYPLRGLHWIGNNAVLAFRALIQGRVIDDV